MQAGTGTGTGMGASGAGADARLRSGAAVHVTLGALAERAVRGHDPDVSQGQVHDDEEGQGRSPHVGQGHVQERHVHGDEECQAQNDEKEGHVQDDEKEGHVQDDEEGTGEAGPQIRTPAFLGGVYVLANRDNARTYVGCAGVSFRHRLRQHNREITGGAAATAGCRTWYHALLVTGFVGRIQALSFEWYVKKYKWFHQGAWDGVSRRDRMACHRRKVELLQQKFGGSKFPNLVVHDVAGASLDRPAGCACFDCECRGGGPHTARRRRIVPTCKVLAPGPPGT